MFWLIPRELIGDVDQLVGNDPANAAGYGNRNQDGGKNGHHAADVQSLEKRHRGCQQKSQRKSKCKRDQNLARKVQCRDRSQQDDGPRVTPELGRCAGPRWRADRVS